MLSSNWMWSPCKGQVWIKTVAKISDESNYDEVERVDLKFLIERHLANKYKIITNDLDMKCILKCQPDLI